MAIKGNNKLPKNHFHKDWQRYVKCHFDQPGSKTRRRNARRAKAAALAPRPVDKLRPVVRCPTIKYNRRVRAGRGFTLAELKEAGIAPLTARTLGIAVDGRRQNLSEESLAANVARLKEYKQRLIIFPRQANRPKAGDSSADDLKAEFVSAISSAVPIVHVDKTIQEISKSDMPEPIERGAYNTLRIEKSKARLRGKREKKAAEKAAAEDSKK